MALYITVNNIEGHDDFGMRTRQSLEPLQPRDGEVLIVMDDLTEHPDGLGKVWNRQARAFEDANAPASPLPIERVTGSKIEFSKKVGFTRESMIHELIDHPDTPRKIKGKLRTAVAWLGRADGVTLTDDDTIAQTQLLASVFSNADLMALIDETPMTEQDAADYITAVLTPWTV